MDPIICSSCKNSVVPKSGACPVCGHEFTLKEIIPDAEVEEFKEKTMNSFRIPAIILGGVCLFTYALGGLWCIITAIMFIPFLYCALQYVILLPLSFESWRVSLSKTWKYRSTLEKAGFILKILTKI